MGHGTREGTRHLSLSLEVSRPHRNLHCCSRRNLTRLTSRSRGLPPESAGLRTHASQSLVGDVDVVPHECARGVGLAAAGGGSERGRSQRRGGTQVGRAGAGAEKQQGRWRPGRSRWRRSSQRGSTVWDRTWRNRQHEGDGTSRAGDYRARWRRTGGTRGSKDVTPSGTQARAQARGNGGTV